MPIYEGFHPAHPLPLAPADGIEQEESGNARGGFVASSRVLKVSVLVATVAAAAIAVAALSARGPAAVNADVTASLVANSKPQADTDQATQVQSTADATALVQPAADPQVLPLAAKDASTREETAAAEPAVKDQAEKGTPETLFKQFQAWAAEQDGQPKYRPLIQGDPVQVVARVAGNTPAADQLKQKRRYVRPVQNARAEARTENVRKKVRRAPRAQAARPPVQDARAQSQPVRDTQASSFLPGFGLRN